MRQRMLIGAGAAAAVASSAEARHVLPVILGAALMTYIDQPKEKSRHLMSASIEPLRTHSRAAMKKQISHLRRIARMMIN